MKNASFAAAFAAISWFVPANPLAAQPKVISFELVPNPRFLECLRDPTSSERPTARVTVVRGDLNDTLHLHLKHIKPELAFDLFTVQRSSLRSQF